MESLRFKVGDRVRIKSLDWYYENKDEDGTIIFSTESGDYNFTKEDTRFCGRVVTIAYEGKGHYLIAEDDRGYFWIDEMIECKVGKVEEENQSREMLKENAKHYLEVITGGSKPKFKVGDKVLLALHPCVVNKVEWRGDSKYVGYVYTVRGTDFGKKVKEADLMLDPRKEETKPTLSKNAKLVSERFAEDVNVSEFKPHQNEIMKVLLQGALNIPEGYIFKDENGNIINATKIVLEKKKNEYPKTYEECINILGGASIIDIITYYYGKQLKTLYKLLICRDAYWKIAGKEMGLGKPWEPDFRGVTTSYVITVESGKFLKSWTTKKQVILTFPTAEMRDAFYDNFKELIESCKELL